MGSAGFAAMPGAGYLARADRLSQADRREAGADASLGFVSRGSGGASGADRPLGRSCPLWLRTGARGSGGISAQPAAPEAGKPADHQPLGRDVLYRGSGPRGHSAGSAHPLPREERDSHRTGGALSDHAGGSLPALGIDRLSDRGKVDNPLAGDAGKRECGGSAALYELLSSGDDGQLCLGYLLEYHIW